VLGKNSSVLAPFFPAVQSEEVFGGDINDHGEISGQAIDPNTGALVGFLAIPTHDEADYQANPLAEPKVALPENARVQPGRPFGCGPR